MDECFNYLLFSGLPNRSSRIICNTLRWNLLGQVGGTPGVGSARQPLYKEGGGSLPWDTHGTIK